MSLPDLNILIPTYNRPDILKKVMHNLMTLLIYDGNIRILVGDDSDNNETFDMVTGLKEFGQRYFYYQGPRASGKTPAGLGANLNMLIKEANSDILMQLDDDHLLVRQMNISSHAYSLLTNCKDGWIRLMGIGAHKYKANLEGLYWKIDWESPECYITSNRPHIKHRNFHNIYCFYPVGLKIGATEESFCHNVIDKAKASYYRGPAVYVPLDCLTESSWEHLGDSWQMHGE